MKKIDKKELNIIFDGIRNNNELEFDKLYKNYKDLVYGVAFSMLKNEADSDEIVQNVFMKIFKLEKEKLPKERHASWLYEVTKNETINFLRNKKQEIDIDEIYCIEDTADQVSDVIENDVYNKIISKLNERDQEIVSLKVISNLSFREIAELLKLPMGTVQWRYYKAIHTLKLFLSNLSMFVITIAAFIAKRFAANRVEEENIQQEEQEKEETKENVTDSSEEKKKDEIYRGEEDSKDVQNVVESDKEEQEGITLKPDEDLRLDAIDVGMIGVSVMFFIIAMCFFVGILRSRGK